MSESPVIILIYASIAVYLLKVYGEDYALWRGGEPRSDAMPGATGSRGSVFLLGAAVALLILGVETLGEIVLGVADEQSDVVAVQLVAMLAAGVIEETVFRGFLVVTSRGRKALVGSIIGFSLAFALIHPFLWEYEAARGVSAWRFWEADFTFNFTVKAWFSTAIVFVNSLWFYALRFGPWNPERSIFPCMLAHAASNLGVFLVKLAQGHVTGWL